MATIDRNPAQQVARMMDGYLLTQLLYVAAKLDIAVHLASGPHDAESLASKVGAHPDALCSILRGLAAEGFLDEDADDRFGLTELGTCLRADAPGTQRGAILARGDVYYMATAGLLDAVRHGGTGFEQVHGVSMFEYFNRNPEHGAAFQGSMADRARQEAADVIAAYDFSRFSLVVDVGAGAGILLEAILRAAPHSRGVLMDRPAAVERAAPRLTAAGLGDRLEFAPGDFFEAVPRGGDAYVLSRVIHDWGDEHSVQILTRCREVMHSSSTLLLVEAVLPERARQQPAAIRMDLHMLVLLGGRERTAPQYSMLLEAAGLKLVRVVPTESPAGLSVVEAVVA
jgi:hypothetical protein